MKDIKRYKTEMEELLELIEEFQEIDCDDIPKNRIIRFRNQNMMKQLKREIEDISEGEIE